MIVRRKEEEIRGCSLAKVLVILHCIRSREITRVTNATSSKGWVRSGHASFEEKRHLIHSLCESVIKEREKERQTHLIKYS